MDATTSNDIGSCRPTMLRPFAWGQKFDWFQTLRSTSPNNMQQGVLTDTTCNFKQCWELFVNNVVSVCFHSYQSYLVKSEQLNGTNCVEISLMH